MKRTVTNEKSELSLYMQANNSIYGILAHDKHESTDLPLNKNLLSYTEKNLDTKLTRSLFAHPESATISSGFKYSLILFSIFHFAYLAVTISIISMLYTLGKMPKIIYMTQITVLIVILITSVLIFYSFIKNRKMLMHSRIMLTGLGIIIVFYLIFTDNRILSSILKKPPLEEGQQNIIMLGIYIVSFRYILMDSFKCLLLLILIAINLTLILFLAFSSISGLSLLSDFFILLAFLIIQAFDTYQMDFRIKQLFWKSEKELHDMEEYDIEENGDINVISSISTEVEVLIKCCDKIKKDIKSAYDVIMYKDVKSKLKVAQIELERVKRRLAHGTIMDVVRLEHHPGISEEDKTFIYENFTDFNRSQVKRKSRYSDSRVTVSSGIKGEFDEFEDLLEGIGNYWNLDIWFIHQTTCGSLYFAANYIINKWNLFTSLNISMHTSDSFFMTLESVMYK